MKEYLLHLITYLKILLQFLNLFFSFTTLGSAVSSTKGIVRLSSAQKAHITMPDELRDLLVGILLGDAHIAKRSPTSNSRLTYAQTAVAHKEYFDYVFSFFIP